MAPIHRLSHLLGSSISSVIFGLIRTGLIIGAASLFFNINLSNTNIPAAVLVLTLSSISFLGLGLLGAALPLLSPEKGIQATHILQSMILLISGIYYEITVLPAWLQPFSRFSPATYTLQAMRMALLEGAGIYELKYMS